MTDTNDIVEDLKEIAEYVSEQRVETDLARVQGYGIDTSARSVRFSLKPVADAVGKIATLETKTADNERNISRNTQKIGDLNNRIDEIVQSDLPERNRKNIEQLRLDLNVQGTEIERSNSRISANSKTISEVSERVLRTEEKTATLERKSEDAERDIDELRTKILLASKQVLDMEEYTAIEGEIVQYAGETDSTYEHGGFYEWNGSAWVRVRVDARYKAGKDIEITEDGTINATFDHSPIEAEIKAVADDLTAHKTAQATKDKAQDDATKANTDAIATLNGGEQTSGSVKNTVLDYIGKAQHARFKVVQTLPPVKDAESNVLYLVPFEGKEGVYKQYILADGKFVQLDNTEVDLSNYYTKHETDTAISDVADALTAKDTEQDGRISALESKPSPTSQCVPYSADLDGISDDLGVAWMNVSKESREFGHLYKRDGQEIVIPNDTYYYVTTEDYNKYDEWDIPTERKLYEFGTKELASTKRFCKYNLTPYKLNADGTRTLASEVWSNWATTTLRGNYLVIGSEKEATLKSLENYNTFHNPQVTIKSDTEIEIRHYNNLHNSNMVTIASYVKDFDYSVYSLGCGGFAYSVRNTEASPIYNPLFCERANEKAVEIFGDKFSTDYYAQTSLKAITEVGSLKRLETWEEEKIEGGWKDVYDTSTITADISAEVQRATQAESALSTMIDGKADVSKWTDILFSQINADHQTLGTLNTYLSESKRTSIDGAVAKAHTQNTDTMLNNGTLKVESNKISATLPIVSSGDIEGVGTDNKHHLLSKKMDSAMLRTYNSFADMVADKANNNIPQGAWCAIIE